MDFDGRRLERRDGMGAAQPSVTVQGTLKGYFLSPNGNLSVYEVPFTFPNKPSNGKLPNQLFPLWARYYLGMYVKVSGAKIQRLQLQVSKRGKMATIETIERSPGSDMIAVPELPNNWLTVHAKADLNLVLIINLESGEKVTIHPQYVVSMLFNLVPSKN